MNSCKCNLRIVEAYKSKEISIFIEDLPEIICKKISDALEEGCFISFFGDFDCSIDISIKKTNRFVNKPGF